MESEKLNYRQKLENHIKHLESKAREKSELVEQEKANFNQILGALDVSRTLLTEYIKDTELSE